MKGRKVASLAELEAALPEIRGERRTSVVVIATDPAASTNAGGARWDVAIPEFSERTEVAAARAAARTSRRVNRPILALSLRSATLGSQVGGRRPSRAVLREVAVGNANVSVSLTALINTGFVLSQTTASAATAMNLSVSEGGLASFLLS